MNILKEIYNEDHLGVSVIREALNPIEVAKILDTLTCQKNRYKPLPFGSAMRWNFSTDDLKNFTSLEKTLEIFSNISDCVNNVTEINPVFETRLCSMFYPTGSSGVEPHRDSIHSVNSVLIFVLSGNNKFYAAHSFDDTEEVEFHT